MAKRRIQSNRRRRTTVSAVRYNEKLLRRDREYGFFWYSWLWKLLRPLLVFACSLVVVLGIVSSGWRYVNTHFFMPVDSSDTQVVEFVIDKGSSISAIGSKLYDQQLIRNKGVFKYIIQFQGLTSKIQYGSYPLSKSMDVNQVISVLTAGTASNERTITIIPGWTITDIADYLVKQGALNTTTREEFIKLCNNTALFKDDSYALQNALAEGGMSGRIYALEGYLAPDTYRIYTSATPESILRTLLKQTDAVIDKAQNSRPDADVTLDESGEPIEEEVVFETTLSMEQTIILASIIEKEAGQKADYAKVSAVFHNRLERGINLDSDATVSYPLGVQRMVLTSEELNSNTPYNTYLNPGLPAGPICNPSLAAIQAALYPDMDYVFEEYLYFCSKDPTTGELQFSKTREEHQAAVEQYRPLWEAYDARSSQS